MTKNIKLEGSWKAELLPEFRKPYMLELRSFLVKEISTGKNVYPKGDEYFQALNLTPLDRVKVVILGQDPYHGPNQAHGLSFSVRPGVKAPPSLRNIYKEIQGDLGVAPPNHGYLEKWSKQGILLLNSVLTVEAGCAASHKDRGWEIFTDEVIKVINTKRSNVVFLLWGSYAQKKGRFIDKGKHCVITSHHPSPLSAHRGFFGSKPFSKTNDFLSQTCQEPIDWSLENMN